MTGASPGSDYVGGLPAGFLLQEYQIERVLGHGGFGVTYLARDTMLQKAVAIKEYLPMELAVRDSGNTVSVRSSTERQAYEQGLSSFLNEARVLARFSHPNLIGVYRFFQANNTAYFVMEYAEGNTLRAQVKKEGMLSEERIRQLLMPVMAGLDGVHREGILHRDIKPDNILVKKTGNAILIDFGAARYAVSSASRAITSVLTVGFAPIEQYSTHSSQGAWTDIYALGAVMYYLISGSKPIDAVARMENDPLEPATEMGKGRFGASFLANVDWALRVKAEERPQTLGEWREALEGNRPVPAFVTAPRPVRAPELPERTTVAPVAPALDRTEAPTATATTPAERPTAAASPSAPAREPRSRPLLWAGLMAAALAGAGVLGWFLATRNPEPAAAVPVAAPAPVPAAIGKSAAVPKKSRAPAPTPAPATGAVAAGPAEEPRVEENADQAPAKKEEKKKKSDDIPVGF